VQDNSTSPFVSPRGVKRSRIREKRFLLGSQVLLSPTGIDPLTLPWSQRQPPRAPGPHLWGHPKPAPSPSAGARGEVCRCGAPCSHLFIPITQRSTGVMSCAGPQPPNQLLDQPSSSGTNILPKENAGCDGRAERGCLVQEPLPPGCNIPGTEAPGWLCRWARFYPQLPSFQLPPAPGQKKRDPFHPRSRICSALACGRLTNPSADLTAWGALSLLCFFSRKSC